MNTNKISVVIADDHELFLDGLVMLIQSLDDIELIGTASNGHELINMVKKLAPDVVLTDINMPLIDGIEATKKISAKFPKVRVVALTMYDEGEQIIEMIEAGAMGYLVKNASKEEINEAIISVYNNISYFCKQTTLKISQLVSSRGLKHSKETNNAVFKEVEKEIIRHICNGLTSKEIGVLIHLSYRTVEGYRVKIQEKMNVSNIAGIIKYALKHNLITD
jgi:DNA-binding NarL/FixJ family response regulator